MGNTYFRFKQFNIDQEHCAMKVCTDACIQGAFTAQYLASGAITVSAILDIGAGTGLLSLMIAQQIAVPVTAVELDPAAAKQAAANFQASPWAERLQLTEQDVRKMTGGVPFDFIVTNPPFYEAALKSGHAQKDQAMHATNLAYDELLAAIDQQLAPGGECSVLLPYVQFEVFREMAEAKGYHLRKALQVKQSVKHGYFRTVGIFSKTAGETVVSDLSIYDEHHHYTPDFEALLRPYYLKL
ncbi:tRNA1(Val) (adenine(37)-N6)-methyltransferase [Chitinophaga qingshengii]|uniref:tRNA1(Val) (adenine(37)-N6)-methyltransferase n=1 Tax=Chitinophaga qingshengii TaxID=1569794 RepID=A0ABR7TIF4_9BACT|nr:methyltransferase [Chitinophaga qingshengii]MBC9929293.1 methyltransferase [Chitinophaga qingshengii]